MKIKVFISTAVLAIALSLGSCSDKDDVQVPDITGTKSVYLKINTSNQSGNTRAVEPSQTGDKAELLSAIIYFVDSSADPVIYAVRTAGEFTSDITLTQLEAGYQFTNIPSSVTQVYVVGNYNSSDQGDNFAQFPTTPTGLLSTVQDVVLDIQEVAYNSLANGSTGTGLLTVMDGISPVKDYDSNDNTWNGDNTLTNGDKYADISLVPINSRIEILEISYSGLLLSQFTLQGIYINNYYPNTTLATQDPSTIEDIVNNGSIIANYDETDATNFKYTDLTTLYNTVGQQATTGATSTVPGSASFTPGATNTWAYHVFGNSNPVPHIILKLTNITYTSGTPAPEQLFVTVKGYQQGVTPITTFARNTIYKITDLAFSDDDLDILPETEDINIWIHVDVANWTTLTVTPII